MTSSTTLAGTGALAKLAFRRDRIMLPAWVYVITAAIASNSYSMNKLYPTAADRAQLAASAGRNPALVFLYGRLWGDSLGAVSAWRYGVWAAIFAALMSVFLVVRHTRADEEAGRLELVGSAAVGRLAALTAGLLVALAANVVLAVLWFKARSQSFDPKRPVVLECGAIYWHMVDLLWIILFPLLYLVR